MDFITEVENYLKKIITECGYELDNVHIVPTNKKEFGDYQFNEVMSLAKKYEKNPRDIATEITEKIDNPIFKKVEVAGPGFINLTFSDESLVEYANILKEDLELNYPKINKTIFIDYGGANVAKALHVGHLRSANIGQALYNLLKACGINVIGDAHLGDIGRQCGMIISEIKREYPNSKFFKEDYNGDKESDINITIKDLETWYPKASLASKEDESRLEEVRQITADLEKGHKGYEDLWDICKNISINDIKRIYKRINTDFDLWLGETDALKYMPELINFFEQKDLVKNSDGARVVEVAKEDDKIDVPPLLLVKSNGAYSYETTDLASIWDRMNNYKLDEIWYVVDSRQKLHFDQVFRASRISGLVPDSTKLEFIGFGTINGTDGKPFKTRDGGVMKLESLIDMVKTEAEKKILPSIIEERDEIAETVAVAAIKYADLLPYRATDYIFDPVKFTDITGKTGTYLLYSTVRMKSLLRKASEQNIKFNKINSLNSELERDIILNLINLKQIINNAINNKSLNEITEYLYKITNIYNNFYSINHILTSTDKSLQESWLTITKLLMENNIKLLNILGISVPEKM